MDKILNTNIRTVSRLLTEGTVKTSDFVRESLKRIKETENLKAFITVTGNEAEELAKQSEKRYKNGQPLSDMDGVIIGIKDNFCTKGISTTCASKMLENFKPPYNATAYQRFLDAGAILIGKTNLDQFAMGSGTINSIYGVTKNNWGCKDDDNFYIAGGSSGGSAVAVATGACFACLGSDTGGSVRNPASYCGVIGLKPTYGLISRLGLIPLVNSMDVVGILTRTVDDTVSVLNTIAGFDEKDSTSLTKPFKKIRLPPASKMKINGIKIGIPLEYNVEYLSEEVANVWNDIASMLKSEGAIIKPVSLPHTEYSIVVYSILNQCEVTSNMARYDGIEFGLRAREDYSTEKLYSTTRRLGFDEVVKGRILAGNYFLLASNYDKYFTKALKSRRLILNDFDNVWNEVDFLLTPTTLTEAPLYKDYVGQDNRHRLVEDYCTQAANLAGIPAISVPIKLSKNGLPLSIQLMGRNLSEPMLLAVSKFIENAVKFPHFQYNRT
ncbi:unnamed protein product [Phyllotreta striolata]|uniref:Glutamyl-tRNA(Gln) amidotransferase subunit A, mitochondrial n=1 Tax=Phyllotreta striolata TaxID=444603 RepID=A0A9N9TEX6_PHYSR|nr:unnamed protein product [Phyllotreta striolata]